MRCHKPPDLKQSWLRKSLYLTPKRIHKDTVYTCLHHIDANKICQRLKSETPQTTESISWAHHSQAHPESRNPAASSSSLRTWKGWPFEFGFPEILYFHGVWASGYEINDQRVVRSALADVQLLSQLEGFQSSCASRTWAQLLNKPKHKATEQNAKQNATKATVRHANTATWSIYIKAPGARHYSFSSAGMAAYVVRGVMFQLSIPFLQPFGTSRPLSKNLGLSQTTYPWWNGTEVPDMQSSKKAIN